MSNLQIREIDYNRYLLRVLNISLRMPYSLCYALTKPHSDRRLSNNLKKGSHDQRESKNKNIQNLSSTYQRKGAELRIGISWVSISKYGGEKCMKDNQGKLVQSIVYVLEQQPTEILRVVKLIYLADYLYAKSFGGKKPFTGDYVREKYGPLPEMLYGVLDSLYEQKIVERTGNVLKLKKKISLDKLTEQEIACLQKVIQDFSSISTDKLLKVAYSTEPMLKMQEQEAALNVDKLLYQKIDFSNTKKHPLLDNDSLDTSFMDSPEFLANLRDA